MAEGFGEGRRGRGGRGGGRGGRFDDDRNGNEYRRRDYPDDENGGSNQSEEFGESRRGRGGGRGGRGGGRGGRFDDDRNGGEYQRRDYTDDENGSNNQSERFGGGRRGRGGGRGGRFDDDRNGGEYQRRDYTDDESCSNNQSERYGGGRRGRGGGRGGRFDDDRNGGEYHRRDNTDDENGFNNQGEGFGGGRRGRGGDRGGRFGDDRNDDDNNGEGRQENRPPVYVPKEKTDEELWADSGIMKGINFKDYRNIKVDVTGENPPRKISSFSEAQFRDLLMNNLNKCRYDEPTPVQQWAIPIIMEKRDLMASAQTGSGKTAAYLLPTMHMILNENIDSTGGVCAPQILILSPTRELAIQIHDVAKKFAQGSYLKVRILYGGTSMSYQNRQLQEGCNILVATPGRLNDFVNRNNLDFSGIKFLILDEADRMLDQRGFREDIQTICSHDSMTPTDQRQTLMFSATFSQEVQQFARNYLKNYIFLAIGVIGGACKDVKQTIIEVQSREKKMKLKEILDSVDDVLGTLIFVQTKRTADFIASYLSSSDFPTTSIHGDRFQSQREEALRDFRSKRMKILVATAVAARGLDINGVKHVINYDLPETIDEYVHRIGRTGRLGNQGLATSFFDSTNNCDRSIAAQLVHILKQAGQEIPDFLNDASASSGGYSSNDNFGGGDFRQNSRGDNQTTTIDEDKWD